MAAAAFIDRDGVINEERGFVHRIADFAFIPGSVAALRELRAAGHRLVVITNQSGIARGLYSEADFHELNAYMCARLAEAGVMLDAVRYCPHLPDASVTQYRLDCECRKPRAGMLLSAAHELNIDTAASLLVGDRKADIEAGRLAGVGRCYLVRSGKPLSDTDVALADGVFADLAQCVAVTLR
ncbi:MAG: D-glycero-beta-D-manno-heptose 1,7-bisphosphate 7-phosphatase [Proteobacteria bacterium]|nr:D-glycero-beta-D-manno-heptose 1,7-bisphosphate 7-phosphatase [Pseudomonadota bacterium]